MVDELAGKDDKPGKPQFEPLVEKRGQLARKAGRRRVVRLAGGVEHNARLGGVGHQKAQIRVFGAVEHGFVFLIGIEAAGHAGNDPFAVDRLFVFPAPQEQGIKPLLVVDELRQTRRNGLDQHHLAVKARLFVHLVDKAVHKGPQEISLAELQHPFGRVLEQVAVITLVFKRLVIEQIHSIRLTILIDSPDSARKRAGPSKTGDRLMPLGGLALCPAVFLYR